ncbi:MAG: MFS transporter [Anaerolineae bacterium]|nr:MAG: MFS transporter [Anaerolineae bacterium]
MIGFVGLWAWLPSDHPGETSVHLKRVTPALAWRTLRESQTAQAALLFSMFLMMANEVVYINFSIWLEDTFDLAVTSLGAATIVIGAAEVMGEILVIRVSDRIGKRRLALGGALFSSGFYMLLPFLNFHLVAALAGLFAVFIFFEASIVSSLSMFTEVLPNARAVMMSSNVGATSIGRLTGGLIGGLAFELLHSFHLVGALALVLGLAAAAVMHFRIGEQVGTPEAVPSQ